MTRQTFVKRAFASKNCIFLSKWMYEKDILLMQLMAISVAHSISKRRSQLCTGV